MEEEHENKDHDMEYDRDDHLDNSHKSRDHCHHDHCTTTTGFKLKGPQLMFFPSSLRAVYTNGMTWKRRNDIKSNQSRPSCLRPQAGWIVADIDDTGQASVRSTTREILVLPEAYKSRTTISLLELFKISPQNHILIIIKAPLLLPVHP